MTTNSTARNPQASDRAVRRHDFTPSVPMLAKPAARRFAEGVIFPDPPDPADFIHPSGRQLTYDELAHGF